MRDGGTPLTRAELRACQLRVLRDTYPGWRITYCREVDGREWWVGELRRPMTGWMRAAGVAEVVRQVDAIALAATLSCQAVLIRGARARTGPG